MLRRSSWFVFIGALAYAGAAAALDPADKCEATKLKAAGKYGFCRLKAESKGVKKGEPPDFTKCDEKYSFKWQQAETVAGAGACPSEGDETAVQAFITQHTDDVAAALAGGPPPNCPDAPPTGCLGVLLRTGQIKDYGPGSDGDLQKGVGRFFTDNGDGTITDDTTGLMWEKKSDDGSIHDKDNTYTWGMASAPYTLNGTMVTTFLAALNGGGGFAGYTDWRIPNRFELRSLVNLGDLNPAVYAAFDTSCAANCTVTACSCTKSDDYWSSTTYQGDPAFAWAVYLFTGEVRSPNGIYYGDKSDSLYVRAVRGGS